MRGRHPLFALSRYSQGGVVGERVGRPGAGFTLGVAASLPLRSPRHPAEPWEDADRQRVRRVRQPARTGRPDGASAARPGRTSGQPMTLAARRGCGEGAPTERSRKAACPVRRARLQAVAPKPPMRAGRFRAAT